MFKSWVWYSVLTSLIDLKIFRETFIFLMIFLRYRSAILIWIWRVQFVMHLSTIFVYKWTNIGTTIITISTDLFQDKWQCKMSWISKNKEHFYDKINVIVADKIDKTPCQPAYLKADHCLREKTERVFECLKK